MCIHLNTLTDTQMNIKNTDLLMRLTFYCMREAHCTHKSKDKTNGAWEGWSKWRCFYPHKERTDLCACGPEVTLKQKESKAKQRALQSLKKKNTSTMMTHMPSCHSLCSQNIIFPIKTHTGDPRAANQAAWLGGKTLLGFPRSLISNDSTAKQTEAEEPAGAP